MVTVEPRARDDADDEAGAAVDDRGGDAACWANLVCEECGAVRGDEHRAGCTHADAR